jgi:hypothetical protein
MKMKIDKSLKSLFDWKNRLLPIIMPMIDNLVLNEDERATGFSHANEIAKPNYYKVKLDNGIVTEISPTISLLSKK